MFLNKLNELYHVADVMALTDNFGDLVDISEYMDASQCSYIFKITDQEEVERELVLLGDSELYFMPFGAKYGKGVKLEYFSE